MHKMTLLFSLLLIIGCALVIHPSQGETAAYTGLSGEVFASSSARCPVAALTYDVPSPYGYPLPEFYYAVPPLPADDDLIYRGDEQSVRIGEGAAAFLNVELPEEICGEGSQITVVLYDLNQKKEVDRIEVSPSQRTVSFKVQGEGIYETATYITDGQQTLTVRLIPSVYRITEQQEKGRDQDPDYGLIPVSCGL